MRVALSGFVDRSGSPRVNLCPKAPEVGNRRRNDRNGQMFQALDEIDEFPRFMHLHDLPAL